MFSAVKQYNSLGMQNKNMPRSKEHLDALKIHIVEIYNNENLQNLLKRFGVPVCTMQLIISKWNDFSIMISQSRSFCHRKYLQEQRDT